MHKGMHKDVSVFIENILKSVALALQNFHEIYIVFDKRSKNVQIQWRRVLLYKV